MALAPPCPSRRALRESQRVRLYSGACQKIEFPLIPRDLSMVTDLRDIIVAQGKYRPVQKLTLTFEADGCPDWGVPSTLRQPSV